MCGDVKEIDVGMKYKVGDVVRVVNLDLDKDAASLGLENGLIGVVEKVSIVGKRPIDVLLDGRESDCGFSEDELELVQDGETDTEHEPVKVKQYNPLEVQEGGGHYKTKGIQPVEYGLANNLSFPQVNIVKYVTRHEDKNGLEDLSKSIHYHFFEALRCYGVEGSTELKKRVLKMLGE